MYRKFSLTEKQAFRLAEKLVLGITACRCLASRIWRFWHAVKLETRPETLGNRFNGKPKKARFRV